MQSNRHREETMYDDSKAWELTDFLSDPAGSCDASPGDLSYPYVYNLSGSNQYKYKYREMDDVVTTGFEKASSKGAIFNNAMESLSIESLVPNVDVSIDFMIRKTGCTPTRWYCWRRRLVEGTHNMSAILGTNLWAEQPDIDVSSLQSQALASAWAKRDPAKILGLVSLAEMNKTVGGLADLLNRVYRIAKYAKAAHWRMVAREFHPKELAEIYMNARYNLRPLMYEANGLIKIFNDQISRFNRHTFRGWAESSEIQSDSIAHPYISHGIYFTSTLNVVQSVQREVTARAGVLTQMTITDEELYGLNSFAISAFELTKYSFILDWFVNIGDTVRAFQPVSGCEPLASWVSVEDTTSWTTHVTGISYDTYSNSVYKITDVALNVPARSATKTQRVKFRLPEPARSAFPSFRLKLDPYKLLDLWVILGKISKMRHIRV